MPLGFERLNERTQRPNPLINFIKPLDTPHKKTSEEFLSRIAAQCYPVMKKHHISVMALEEYEPNPEFLGRNFNAGEVIQLVLKDKRGNWLSMKFVQMVMMHELAHCKQMNHSRFFWGVRNEYAKQMEELWKEKYMGEGMWGRGRGLDSGAWMTAAPPSNEQIPEHLCGGSYRRRGRKRKRGQQGVGEQEKLSYAERQQKRIARKFGKHGVSMEGQSVGDDELLRGALETSVGGKRGTGKPRVANSKRGRELRAAAALARFDQAKQVAPDKTPELDEDDIETESEDDWEHDDQKNAVIISDGHGHDLVKVCGDGEDDEEDACKEMDELRMLSAGSKTQSVATKGRDRPPTPAEDIREDSETECEEDGSTAPEPGKGAEQSFLGDAEADINAEEEIHTTIAKPPSTGEESLPASQDLLREIDHGDAKYTPKPNIAEAPTTSTPQDELLSSSAQACPMCSLENEPGSPTCIACSNVLRPELVPNSWSCKSDTCKESTYINAGDAGRCGLCGAQKPKTKPDSRHSRTDDGGRPIGITRPEVLRWD